MNQQRSPSERSSQEHLEKDADPQAAKQDEAGEEKDRQFVTALARGLSILRCWRSSDQYLGNQEIAARTGLPKPTVSRLTYTLTRLGYLDYAPTLEKYSLGVAVLTLGHAYLASQTVRSVARPLMQRFAEEVQSTVMLGTADALNMVVVEVCQGSQAVHIKRDVGQRVPHGTTALGRAYIAGLPPAMRGPAIDNFRQLATAEDWPAVRAGIERACIEADRSGFVHSYGEWRPDIYAVGVPLVSDHGDKVYALSCSGPVYTMTKKRLLREIGPSLVRLRDQIKAMWGGRI
jgi:DNA-binding IclR family transcriptional regulator